MSVTSVTLVIRQNSKKLPEVKNGMKNMLFINTARIFGTVTHGDPTDMRESTSVFQIRRINWSKLDN